MIKAHPNPDRDAVIREKQTIETLFFKKYL